VLTETQTATTQTPTTLTLDDLAERYPATSTLRTLEAALADGLRLCAYASPVEAAREDLTALEAADIAAEDGALVYARRGEETTDPHDDPYGCFAAAEPNP